MKKADDGRFYYEDKDVLYEVLFSQSSGLYEVSEVKVFLEKNTDYGDRTRLVGKEKQWYQGKVYSSFQNIYLTKEEAEGKAKELNEKNRGQ